MMNVNTYLLLFGISHPEDYFIPDELNFIESHLNLDVEKTNVTSIDEWGNFNEELLKNKSNPYLDLFVLEKLDKHGITPKSIWPNDKKFAVCLTHDVDRVELYSPKVFKRNIYKRFRFTKNIKSKVLLMLHYLINSIKQGASKKYTEPISNLENWIEIEDSYNVKSTYFFFVRTKSKDMMLYDCDFSLEDEFTLNDSVISVKEYIRLLDFKGFEIGLHGSFKSAIDLNIFGEQKKKLELLLNKKVNSTRQHYLHYSHADTPNIHSANKIRIDSTLGLNKSSGFRNGTSMPFIIETQQDFIWEIPLIFMDSSVLGHQKLTLLEAKERAKNLILQVEKIGGCFTVNFHPDYVNNENYFELYKFILDFTTKKNAYFGTCNDILEVLENVRNSRYLV